MSDPIGLRSGVRKVQELGRLVTRRPHRLEKPVLGHLSTYPAAFFLTVLTCSSPVSGSCPVPNMITNGQPADAGQLMDNFTAMGNCAVSTTGPSSTGSLATFSGTKSVTAGDLTGDITTSGSTETSLAPSGVTPGSYNNANITVDAKGRITAASSGSTLGGAQWGFVESLSPSDVGSVNSESWVGSGYKAIKFVARLTVSADGVALAIRYKLNGAYQNSANYRYESSQRSSSASTNQTSSQSGTSMIVGSGTGSTWGVGADPTNGEGVDFELVVFNPSTTSLLKRVRYAGAYTAPSGSLVQSFGGGTFDGVDKLAPLEGVQFLAIGGNFSGAIEVYGMR